MDVYWQARDSPGEVWKDEVGEDRREERKRCEVTHLGTGCNVSRPGGHHSAALSRVLFKGKQILGGECHCKDTRASSPPISVHAFKSPFLLPSPTNPSSSFLYLVSHPHSTPDDHGGGGGVGQQIYDPLSFRSENDLLTLAISFRFEGLLMELILTTS